MAEVESRIDIVIRAQGDATRALEVTRQGMSELASASRFAALTIASELSPALGTGISQLTTLASTAAITGTALGAFATFGIGATVLALTSFIRTAAEARKRQEELNRAVALGDFRTLQRDLNTLREKEQQLLKEGVQVAVTGFEQESELRADALAAIRNEIERREREIRTIHQQNIEGDRRVEDFKKATESSVKTLRTIEDERLRGEHEINAEALGAYEVFLLAKEDAARESSRMQLAINAKLQGDLQRAIVEAEGAISAEQGAIVEAAARDFGERYLRAMESELRPLQQLMTGLGHSLADTLFDAMFGRTRDLAAAFRSVAEGVVRDIFRNTLAQAFGGRSQGLSLGTFFR